MTDTTTFDDLQKVINDLNKYKKPETHGLDFLNPHEFMGFRVHEIPACPVIKLSKNIECTDEFRKQFDQWALDLFGYKEPEPNVAYMFGNNIALFPSTAAMFINTAI